MTGTPRKKFPYGMTRYTFWKNGSICIAIPASITRFWKLQLKDPILFTVNKKQEISIKALDIKVRDERKTA